MAKETPKKKAVIRKRKEDKSVGIGRARKYHAKVRMTEKVSKRLASIQGLCFAYGNKETLADLFEFVALPAFEKFVAKYAKKAKAERK